MPRFVLLFHACPGARPRPSHWDLMLERGEVLRTWALAQLPRDWAPLAATSTDAPAPAHTNAVSAEPLGDHRPAYLEFEGPLSGNRGHVTRVEAGTFVIREESPNRWEGFATGEVLRGRITLSRPTTNAAWQLSYSPDESGS